MLIFSLSSNAQKRDNSKLSPEAKHDVAQKMIELGGYYSAIEILKEIVANDTANKKYIFKLAEAYFKARDYKNAEKLYPKLKENTAKGKNNFVSIASFHYAECLKYNGKYELAREKFQLFANSNYKEMKSQNLKQLAKNEVKSCEYALSGRTSDIDVKISKMGNNINSGYSDFAPNLKDDNTLIFSSLKSDSVILVEYGENHQEHVKIYESDFENGVWGEAKEIKKLSPLIGHSANATYSQDGKQIYFSSCKNKASGAIICNLYKCNVDSAGQIGKPIKLKNGINHSKFNSTQPNVGRREIKARNSKSKPTVEQVLYFSSDMKGTVGGDDIWFSVIDKQGNVGAPANCGKNINTTKDEITPYYDQDAGMLYFSSNFHPGFGGFDIFKSKGWATKWQKPENLKMPINSRLDDTYYTLLPDNKLKGFLVTNRNGGTPLIHENCCDDIWTLDYKIPTILVVNVVDSISGEEVKDASITIKSGKFDMLDTLANEADVDFDTVFVNNDPHFLKIIGLKEKLDEYYIIGAEKKTSVIVQKMGYNFNKAIFDTDSLSLPQNYASQVGNSVVLINKNLISVTLKLSKGNLKDPSLQKKISNEPKKDTVKTISSLKKEFIKVNSIMEEKIINTEPIPKKAVEEIDITINLTFEYKEIALNDKNLMTLDSLVYVMKKLSNINFEIGTHTDGIGSEQYNMDLSYKRSSFVANYIIKKGISRRRILAKGYGKTRPIANETKLDGSDIPEARQQNRRTEIRMFE